MSDTQRMPLFAEGSPTNQMVYLDLDLTDKDDEPYDVPFVKRGARPSDDEDLGMITELERDENGLISGLVPTQHIGKNWNPSPYVISVQPQTGPDENGNYETRGGYIKSISIT